MSTEADDLIAFTRSLADVSPDPGGLNRDALLFAAGQAAGRRSALWPATALALAALSTALAVVLVVRPPRVVEVERIVYVPTPIPAEPPRHDPAGTQDDLPVPTPASGEPASGSQALAEGLRLRQRVLRDGVGELPQTPWTSLSSSPNEVPDLSSLRLNAFHHDGE